jgi:anti-anti-sigma factor
MTSSLSRRKSTSLTQFISDYLGGLGMVIINHPPGADVSVVIIDQRRLADALGLQELYEEITKAVERGKNKNVVLDFELVETVTSPGLSMLIRAKAKFDEEGARLHLCGLGTNVAEVIQATKLYQLFPVHHDVAAALQAI